MEILGDYLFHRLVVAGEAIAIEAEAFGSVVTATELDSVGTEFAQAPPLLGAVLCGERAGGESVTGGDAVGEEVSNREVGVEVSGVLGNRVGERTLQYLWKDVTGGRYKAPNLYLGKTRLQTGDCVWTDDFRRNPCWTNAAGQPVMGILGMDCLRNYCVQLDFEAARARFLESGCIERAGLGRAFPLTVYPRGLNGYVAIHGTFTGTKGVRPLVDTGCLVDGILDPKEFQLELRTQKAAWTNRFTGRLGFQRYAALFPRAKFAGETYTDLTLDQSPGLVVGGKTNHVNVIGLPFLARHLVTLDFPKKTVYLKRRDLEPMANQAPPP
jgi:hypothetical protein